MLRDFYNNYYKNLIKTEKESLIRNHQFLPEGKIGELYTAGRVLKRGLIQIPYMDLCVGTQCSLCCKECDQWNPYLKNHRCFSYKEICNNMEQLLSNVNYIGRVNVLGGEALLHPEIVEIVQYLADQQKIGQLVIVTNGTIRIKKELLEVCKAKHVMIWVNRYDASSKWNQIERDCRINNIQIVTAISQQWETMGEYGKVYNNSVKELKCVLDHCCFKTCAMLYGNVFYRCGRTAVIEQEGFDKMPDAEKIYADKIHSKLEMLWKLYKMYALEYLEACRYCIPPKKRKIIRAGEQVGGENHE